MLQYIKEIIRQAMLKVHKNIDITNIKLYLMTKNAQN